MGTKLPSEISSTVEILSAGTHVMRENWIIKYKGESNENLKNFLKYYLLCRSGTKLYHFSK